MRAVCMRQVKLWWKVSQCGNSDGTNRMEKVQVIEWSIVWEEWSMKLKEKNTCVSTIML